MIDALYQLLNTLPHDEWRRTHPFQVEFASTQTRLLNAADDDAAAHILCEWLSSQHQPCLFGRIAAKTGLLRFCFLRESDLQNDANLRVKIQVARTAWKRAAWTGDAHGFLIVLLSQRIAEALPSPELMQLATRLCDLYLLVSGVEPDQTYLDELCYEMPVADRPVFRWNVGVNYFCANGDGRWWQDHRIPGGLAFSMNSVGHMAQSGKSKVAIEQLCAELGLNLDPQADGKIRSLGEALTLAMQTIRNASNSVSGPATSLRAAADDPQAQQIQCPVTLPRGLVGSSHCSYRGWYHTDVTVPRAYFRPDVERAATCDPYNLDFTYFFDERVSNPDYLAIGTGIQIREASEATEEYALNSIANFSRAARYSGEKFTGEGAKRLRAEIFGD